MDGSDRQTDHEMRSALAIVRGAAAILGDRGADPDRWNQAADLMIAGLDRLRGPHAVPLESWSAYEI